MTLATGSRLGPYEIVSPLGAGGMGEVYRARDTRLEREVAVKVLPKHLSSSEEMRQRFEREAKAISQLSHPHICALYDVGSHEGTEYLVMELLEGETLAARLTKGALPIEQTLRFGIEIADALDKAHRQGIVHRDLKPGNVMLTKSGVKLLDFGLAKAMAPVTPQSGLTALPTVAGTAQNLTQEGTILGTFQYMAPEQLEGKEADARSDIFAFGAVLYEMATGAKAFTGSSQASLISAILRDEPKPISQVQPMTPPALDRVVKTCLAKDPEDRFQTAHDVRLQLAWIAEGGSQAGVPAPVVSHRKSRERLAWAAAGILAAASVGFGMALWKRAPLAAPTLRFSIGAPEKNAFGNSLAISPDGKWLAFVAHDAGGARLLWVRPMDSQVARPLPGTEEARFPFWSPDSRSIGFFAAGKLKKIDPAGGAPQALCDADDPRGGTWSVDGVILFEPNFRTPLFRVSAAGGTAMAVTAFDPARGDFTHRWSRFLPDGRHFVFLLLGSKPEVRGIFGASLDDPRLRRVIDSPGRPDYASGHLLFVRERTLMAQRFDARRLELTGEPFPVAEGVIAEGEAGFTGNAAFSVSETGILAYRVVEAPRTRLTWVDRAGRVIGSIGDPALYSEPSLFRDGRRLAVGIEDPKTGNLDIWMVDLSRGTFSRLTFDPRNDSASIASPDGAWVAFSGVRGGRNDIYRKSASGAGTEELLFHSDNEKWVDDWTTDGRYIVFENTNPKTKLDIWALPLFGDRKPFPVIQTPFIENHSAVSPDVRWIAYTSDETGRAEVYVQPFPGGGGRWQVSTNGGDQPLWRSDGRELYFLGADRKLMAVEVKAGAVFEAGVPKALLDPHTPPNGITDFRNQYVPAADGQRFLVMALVEEANPSPITVVTNWAADAKK